MLPIIDGDDRADLNLQQESLISEQVLMHAKTSPLSQLHPCLCYLLGADTKVIGEHGYEEARDPSLSCVLNVNKSVHLWSDCRM